jgi:hypothetical protein
MNAYAPLPAELTLSPNSLLAEKPKVLPPFPSLSAYSPLQHASAVFGPLKFWLWLLPTSFYACGHLEAVRLGPLDRRVPPNQRQFSQFHG